ncbi:MAG: cysteine synthase, partial [Deltaproteobacteria bacterium]
MRFRKMDSIVEAVGDTPMVRLRSLEKDAPGTKIFLKLEYANPGGSVKDRPARQMMLDAIEDGRLTTDKILIDATSGNTGVAYSLFGAAMGYRILLVMPSNVSQARKDITEAFGTEFIYSDPMEGSDGAIVKVRQMVAEDPGRYFYADQYSNPSNPRAHYLGTGREILEQVGDEITHFVAGLGTSGACMGTTRRLHEHSRKIQCMAVGPA